MDELTDTKTNLKPSSTNLGRKLFKIISSIILTVLFFANINIFFGFSDSLLEYINDIKFKHLPYATFDFVKINDNRPPGTICQTESNYRQEWAYTALWNVDTVYIYQDLSLKNIVWQERFPREIESVKSQFIPYSRHNLKNGYTLSVVYVKGSQRWLKCLNIPDQKLYEKNSSSDLEDTDKKKISEKTEPETTHQLIPTRNKTYNPFEHFVVLCNLPIGNMTFIDALTGIHLQSEDKRKLLLQDYKGKEVSSFDAGKKFIYGTKYISDGKNLELTIYNGRHYFSFDLNPEGIEKPMEIDTREDGILGKSIITDFENEGIIYSGVFNLFNGIHTFMGFHANEKGVCDQFNAKLDLHLKKVINSSIIMQEDGQYLCFGDMLNKYFPYKFDLIPLIDIDDTMPPSRGRFNNPSSTTSMLCKSKTDEKLSIVTYSGYETNKYVATEVKGIDEQIEHFSITKQKDQVDIYLVGAKSVYRYSNSYKNISEMKRRVVYMEPTEKPYINLYQR